MNLTKTTTVVLTPGEVVQMMRKAFPTDINISAFPSTGKGVYLALLSAGKALEVSYERRSATADDVIQIGRKLEDPDPSE